MMSQLISLIWVDWFSMVKIRLIYYCATKQINLRMPGKEEKGKGRKAKQ